MRSGKRSNNCIQAFIQASKCALLVLALAGVSASAADAPKLDAEKYPQDTPAHAMQSLIKALSGKDLAYWAANLLTPFDSKAMIEKYGSLDKAVEFFSEEKRAAALKGSSDVMQKLLDANKLTQGEVGGIKYARYEGDNKLLQLEQQPDGRWCMNPRFAAPPKK